MSNEEQFEYWNGDAGKRWAREDDTMARMLQPVCEALIDHASPQGCSRAIDVGCGGGSQSLLLARQLGGGASVLGVDISAPMLEVAREKTAATGTDCARMTFLQADAASHAFEPESFDLLFSRFGVMFFDDPVAAFSNLRGAMAAGGKLAFCCWQSMRDNAWTLVPVQAALQHLPPPEAPDPNAPGPFAFADPQRLTGILQQAGFSDVALHSHNPDIRFGEAPTLQENVREMAMIGPVSRLLADQDDAVLERVFSSMEEAMAPYYRDGAICMPGAIWFVTASVA